MRKFVPERDGHPCQCQHCKAENRTKLATEVDHVIPKAKARAMGWTDQQIDADSNLQSINTDCHARKTIEDRGGTPKPKRIIGLDGFPIGEF